MDSTHVHLLLNHVPVIGILIGTIFLMYGIWQKNNSIQKMSLATIFLMALIAIPVFLTGEPAEESVENIPGVLKASIETHEEASELAFWAMEVAGLIALVSFIFQMMQSKMAYAFVMICMVASIATAALMGRTAYLGGQIRHTEIAGNNIANPATEQTKEQDDD
jgi:hypothetical protein